MGGVVGNIIAELSASDLMENYLPNFLFDGRSLRVDQDFQKKFAQIDYQVQRQNLHREDIRDLVELTTGRMDITLVVGTLLLTFCISWYADNKITADDETFPSWFQTMFMISNFSAFGYLLFAVWLAMHASVTSHSIGVRLLTSFTRLSIPTRKEIDSIRVSIVPFLENFLKWGESKLGLGDPSGTASDVSNGGLDAQPTGLDKSSYASGMQVPIYRSPAAVRSEEVCIITRATDECNGKYNRVGMWGPTPKYANGNGCYIYFDDGTWKLSQNGEECYSTHTGNKGKPPPEGQWQGLDGRPPCRVRVYADQEEEDDNWHFDRFRDEQVKWLTYDAFSRICMALGMNQMLQTLSYYIMGVIGKQAMPAAICSFCGVKLLSTLLLRLDVGGVGCCSRSMWALLTFTTLPAMWAMALINTHGKPCTQQLWSLPIFPLHAGWLFFLWSHLVPTQSQSDNTDDPDDAAAGLPTRFRTVFYLNVISREQWRQGRNASRKAGRRIQQERIKCKMEIELQSVRHHLQEKANQATGEAWQAPEMTKAIADVKASIENAEAAAMSMDLCIAASLNREIVASQSLLNVVILRQKATARKRVVDAINSKELQPGLTPEQQRAARLAYDAFEKRCRDLGLDIPEETDPAGIGVRVPYYDDCGRPTTTITSLETGCIVETPRAPESIIFFNDSVERTSFETPGRLDPSESSAHPLTRSFSGSGVELVEPSEEQDDLPSSSQAPIEGITVETEHHLPALLVRRYTLITACFWLLAGGLYTVDVKYSCTLMPHTHVDPTPNVSARFNFGGNLAIKEVAAGVGNSIPITSVRTLETIWPEPFFEVAALLHCALSATKGLSDLILADDFALYSGQLKPNASSPMELHRIGGVASALLCDGVGRCTSLRPDRGEWRLQSLASAGEYDGGAAMALPSAWRKVAAACAQDACSQAWIAAWDGVAIVLATVQDEGQSLAAPRSESSRSMVSHLEIRQRFHLRPGGNFRCARSAVGCEDVRREQGYSQVQALRFLGAGARLLAVMHSGRLLDVWDLGGAAFFGRWDLQRDYASICHSGQQLLLATPAGGDTAKLEIASFPMNIEAFDVEEGNSARKFLERQAPRGFEV